MSASPRPFRALAPALLLLLATPAAADIFVATGAKILSFFNFDSDDAMPHREISSALTGIDLAGSLALDVVHREIWVSDLTLARVSVFDMDADGDVMPLRVIDAVALDSPRGLMIDLVHDEVYVVDFVSNAVFVFPRTQNGNAAPVRTLAGDLTGIEGPVQGFLDLVHDELFVASIGGSGAGIAVFDRATASGNVAPLRVLGGTGGAGSGLDNPRGMYVDLVTDRLVVAEYDINALRLYPRTASGGTAFLAEIAGPATGLQKPFDLVADRFGELIVGTDTLVNPSVRVYAAVSGDQPPDRVITGPSTGFAATIGIASDFARDCSWGKSIDGCIQRDNFERGDFCYWNQVTGGAGCP
ncbi:MAG: hypothetical protein AB7G12_14035 [Thermoanaerobaculia bacterium]